MAANKVEIAFRLPSGIKADLIRNLLCQHLQQQQQQENINQFTSSLPPPTPAMSETSSENVLDDQNLKTFIDRFKSSHEDMFQKNSCCAPLVKILRFNLESQKQPPELFCKNRCS